MSDKQLIFAFLQYLAQIKKDPAIVSEPDSVDIAIQVLTDACGLEQVPITEKKHWSLIHQRVSLPQIFTAGLATLFPPTPNNSTTSTHNLNNNQNNTSSTTSSQTESSPSTTSSTSTSSSPTTPSPTNESSTTPPADFDKFLQLLTKRGFFKNATPGSPEYAALFKTCQERFLQKYPHAQLPQQQPQPTTPATPSEEKKSKESISSQDKAKAESFKEEGNRLLQQGEAKGAIKNYTQAISLDPYNAIYYANRAAAYLNLKEYQKALVDSKESVVCDSKYAKAYYRLGQSHFHLKNYPDAISAFETSLTLFPPHADTRATIEEQLEQARSKLSGGKSTSGGAGGFPGLAGLGDLGQLFNNPQMQQMMAGMMSQFGGGGSGGGSSGSGGGTGGGSSSGGSSTGSSTGGGGEDPIRGLLQNPRIAALRSDPYWAPILQDIETNGQNAVFKYLGDPRFMEQIGTLTSAFLGPQAGGGGS